MTYAPVPPRSNGRALRIVLIVVGLVVALCCVGGAVGGWFLYRTVQGSIGPAQDATVSYLDAVRDGDFRHAYDHLCQRRRADVTLAEFTEERMAEPKLVSYEITGTSVNRNNNQVTGTVTVRVTTETGDHTTEISLLREHGDWRVCS